eukprot:25134-Eustigmatos_ZCMA.PRE.1
MTITLSPLLLRDIYDKESRSSTTRTSTRPLSTSTAFRCIRIEGSSETQTRPQGVLQVWDICYPSVGTAPTT